VRRAIPLAVLLAAATAYAQVYRWVDEQGNLRYMSEAERADAIAAQEGAVARACG
jgi:hypothetical protein